MCKIMSVRGQKSLEWVENNAGDLNVNKINLFGSLYIFPRA
jgi:hypothetical protein